MSIVVPEYLCKLATIGSFPCSALLMFLVAAYLFGDQHLNLMQVHQAHMIYIVVAAGATLCACIQEPPGLWAPPSGLINRHLSAPDLSLAAMAKEIDMSRASSVGAAAPAAEPTLSAVWEAPMPSQSAAPSQRSTGGASPCGHDDDAMAAWLLDAGLLMDLQSGGMQTLHLVAALL